MDEKIRKVCDGLVDTIFEYNDLARRAIAFSDALEYVARKYAMVNVELLTSAEEERDSLGKA